jgi:hypothetical protein
MVRLVREGNLISLVESFFSLVAVKAYGGVFLISAVGGGVSGQLVGFHYTDLQYMFPI